MVHDYILLLIAENIVSVSGNLPLVAHHQQTLTTQAQMLLAFVFQKIFSKGKWQYYQPTSAGD